jgi:UDP-N-acetylmuramyl tripeptide synthase
VPRGVLTFRRAAAKVAGALSRSSGRGATSLPGKVLMRLAPDAIERLSARLGRGSAILSATNGKTTTAAMTAAILERTGARLVHNRAGANMAGGIASALLYGKGDQGLFEVDEFWLDRVVDQVHPHALLLANLFRDQLDRYGELETIADRWAEIVGGLPPETALVLNADDPLVADLGRAHPSVTYFGVDDDSLAMAQMQHAADSKHCRRCGTPYVYDAIYLGHLGRYRCPTGDATRPAPGVRATDVVLHGTRSAAFTLHSSAGEARVELPLPGLYNVYNALGAAALALALGAPFADVVAGLRAVAPAFGRAETVRLRGRDLSILLVKNPAGANEVLRTLTLEPGEHDLLGVLNDNTADGRDVSWIWDADFEVLAGRLRRVTCAGTRADELAVRLKYAGVPTDRIVVRPDLEQALDAALAGGEGPLYALPTYTAMLELRELLTERGVTQGSFG